VGKKKKKPRRVPSEDAAFRIALGDHPEYREAWEKGGLPEEAEGPDGSPMSPTLHLEVHAIIERQLAADDPEGIVAIANQMEERGLSRHDVRHAIGQALASQMYQILNENVPFDEEQYFRELREILDSLD